MTASCFQQAQKQCSYGAYCCYRRTCTDLFWLTAARLALVFSLLLMIIVNLSIDFSKVVNMQWLCLPMPQFQQDLLHVLPLFTLSSLITYRKQVIRPCITSERPYNSCKTGASNVNADRHALTHNTDIIHQYQNQWKGTNNSRSYPTEFKLVLSYWQSSCFWLFPCHRVLIRPTTVVVWRQYKRVWHRYKLPSLTKNANKEVKIWPKHLLLFEGYYLVIFITEGYATLTCIPC